MGLNVRETCECRMVNGEEGTIKQMDYHSESRGESGEMVEVVGEGRTPER
jgi:hypothetical protein